jgi:hypothetical protein
MILIAAVPKLVSVAAVDSKLRMVVYPLYLRCGNRLDGFLCVLEIPLKIAQVCNVRVKRFMPKVSHRDSPSERGPSIS